MAEEIVFKGKVEEPTNYTMWFIVIGFFVFYIYILPKIKRYLRGELNYISVEDLNKKLEAKEDLLLVDVRSPEEFIGVLGHVKQAINVPMKKLSAKLDYLAAEDPEIRSSKVIVMGRGDDDGYKAYKMFLSENFTDVWVVDGGLKNWLRTGYKTERTKYV